jgi:hypothetical protein
MNFPLTPEALERIDGLTNPALVSRLQSTIASITTTLVADGFETEDIEAYLNLIVSGTIDDVIDDLA